MVGYNESLISIFTMLRKSFASLLVLKGLVCSTVLAEPLLVAGDPIIPIDEDISSNSNYPGGEGPENVLDGNSNTKYLNFGRLRAGIHRDAIGRSGGNWELSIDYGQ